MRHLLIKLVSETKFCSFSMILVNVFVFFSLLVILSLLRYFGHFRPFSAFMVFGHLCHFGSFWPCFFWTYESNFIVVVSLVLMVFGHGGFVLFNVLQKLWFVYHRPWPWSSGKVLFVQHDVVLFTHLKKGDTNVTCYFWKVWPWKQVGKSSLNR